MAKIKRLSRKDARKLFARVVKRELKIDTQEYLVRYIYGEFREDISSHMRVMGLIPFAR